MKPGRIGIFLLLLFASLSCEKLAPISRDNPHDPGYVGGSSMPDAPTNLRVLSRSKTQVELRWQDNSSFEKGFKIYRAYGTVGWTEIGTAAANDTSYIDNALNATSTYMYRVRAYSDSTSGYTAVVSVQYSVQSVAPGPTLTGHTGWVNSVAFSPANGETLATGSSDNTAKLWRVSNGTLISTLTRHRRSVSSVSFSPDGQTLASGSDDSTTVLWRVSNGTVRASLSPGRDRNPSSVASLSFSPSGQMLAVGAGNGRAKLWRVGDSTLVTILLASDFGVAVSFSPDGQMFATTGGPTAAKLWRMSDTTVVNLLLGHNGAVTSVCFSPDGQTLATGSYDNTAKLWRVSDGTLIRTLTGHTDAVISVSFSPDGQTLATGSYDHAAKLWRVSDGALITTLTGHTALVGSVSFSPDGQTLATGSGDNTAKLWIPTYAWTTIP